MVSSKRVVKEAEFVLTLSEVTKLVDLAKLVGLAQQAALTSKVLMGPVAPKTKRAWKVFYTANEALVNFCKQVSPGIDEAVL